MEVELLKKYGSVSPGKIENLDGTTETVDFRFSTAIRFYHNMEDADFPLHWHAPGEIISPIEGTYTVTIAGKTVTLQPHDVLIIASGELHSIRAPKTGERYIMNYSVSYFHQIQDMAELFNTFYPFRLVTRQEDPELADQLFAVLAQIEGEYFSTNVYRESEIMALMLHFFSSSGGMSTARTASRCWITPSSRTTCAALQSCAPTSTTTAPSVSRSRIWPPARGLVSTIFRACSRKTRA